MQLVIMTSLSALNAISRLHLLPRFIHGSCYLARAVTFIGLGDIIWFAVVYHDKILLRACYHQKVTRFYVLHAVRARLTIADILLNTQGDSFIRLHTPRMVVSSKTCWI
jgi:hypothetical protein